MAAEPIVYVTSSQFKREEVAILCEKCELEPGVVVGDRFEFDVRPVEIKETLEVDLHAMVRAEVQAAYGVLRVPCVVEHAGLIFAEHADHGYPGGLTKPMWNTLGTRFPEETRSAGRAATARAVVGYCDGTTVTTFEGETMGRLSAEPKGNRAFYWDTVFVPDAPDGTPGDKTYAEIVADPDLGLEHKVLELSQSTKAMVAFLRYRVSHPPALWADA
jgi:inosine/xanthosine triphosphate pyrophosphatase family protein